MFSLGGLGAHWWGCRAAGPTDMPVRSKESWGDFSQDGPEGAIFSIAEQDKPPDILGVS
jgi:hypothetical protein